MIDIPVDEGYAYDVLSIAAVKVAKKPGDLTNLTNHQRLERRIGEQVGWPLHIEISASEQYNQLYQTNLGLFNHIDDMKGRPHRDTDGALTDQWNYQRYSLKRSLQERFFPQNKTTETKIGYL